jgi:hypothetical protein
MLLRYDALHWLIGLVLLGLIPTLILVFAVVARDLRAAIVALAVLALSLSATALIELALTVLVSEEFLTHANAKTRTFRAFAPWLIGFGFGFGAAAALLGWGDNRRKQRLKELSNSFLALNRPASADRPHRSPGDDAG